MSASGSDVKVLGKVVSIAVDGIVADAELVFDKNANLNQETINRNMTNAINQAVADVASINTRVGSLEGALDDKLNISDYLTYATLMRDGIMLKISEVEDEKQDVLTFDNTPTQGSNNPVKSDGIFSAITNVISNLSTLFTTKKISFNSNNSSDTDTGYIEGFVKTYGSSMGPGVRIKTNSTYSDGSSEISLVGGVAPIATISAGTISAYAGEYANIFLTDPTITFDGNPATIDTNGISIIGSGYNANAPIEIKQTTGGDVDIISTEGNVLIHANTEANISASDVRVASENTGIVGSGEVTIFSGNGTASPVTPGNISIEALDGPVAITGNPVTINGKDVSSTINNIFPSGSYTGNDLTTTPGLYLYEAGVDRNHFTPAIDEYTTGLLIVTHEHGIDDSTGDGWNNVCQLFIDMYGNRYSRKLSYTNSVQDIDWTNAPDFTLTS